MNKNIKNKQENKQEGFLKLILFIIVAVILLRYFDISVSEIVDWVKTLWNSIFK